MNTTALKKKLRLAMVKHGYDVPGGKGLLARTMGITPSMLSKAMNGHYRTDAHTREVLVKALSFLTGE